MQTRKNTVVVEVTQNLLAAFCVWEQLLLNCKVQSSVAGCPSVLLEYVHTPVVIKCGTVCKHCFCVFPNLSFKSSF